MHRRCDRWSLHITECVCDVFISVYVNFWVYYSARMCFYVSLSWCLKSGGLAHLGSPLKVCSCTHTHTRLHSISPSLAFTHKHTPSVSALWSVNFFTSHLDLHLSLLFALVSWCKKMWTWELQSFYQIPKHLYLQRWRISVWQGERND